MTAGIVLTGGASTRMGCDKASVVLDGETLARRTARLLGTVCHPVVEVGPGCSGYPHVIEDPPGAGPLAALGAGWVALHAERPTTAVVLSCDLPRLDERAVAYLANRPGTGSVVPILDGRAQPLCARWGAADLDAITALVVAGERSFRALLARPGIEFLEERAWSPPLDPLAFVDADSPEDLARLTDCAGDRFRAR